MKTIRTIQKIFLPILILTYVVTSCTETIEFEFNPVVKPEIVVEGHVPALGYAEVILSKTTEINSNYPQDNLIKNALVAIEDNSGISETLAEVSPGHYRSNKIQGIPGLTYKLTIQTKESQTVINSMDVMPEPVSINRLRARRSILPEVEGVKMPDWEVIVEYTDPANEVNYYRFVEYVNGKVIASYVEDDKLNNGKDNKSFLTNFDRQLAPGDTLTIEMQSISEAVYNYFYSFSYLNQLVQGTVKTNPITNIDGAELGYFSAYAATKKSIVIE
ncbi:MAG TPA: DUF4249 domain-containing protein [Paludibacter sp.]|jgi:hypothetical protein|nr:MAG: hypothetical protein BWY08_01679 [Bacteroidetes bacterium ADurb.Bin174]HQB28023.1 DUF4249 domain-containing protein [Paludibacter sp.]